MKRGFGGCLDPGERYGVLHGSNLSDLCISFIHLHLASTFPSLGLSCQYPADSRGSVWC